TRTSRLPKATRAARTDRTPAREAEILLRRGPWHHIDGELLAFAQHAELQFQIGIDVLHPLHHGAAGIAFPDQVLTADRGDDVAGLDTRLGRRPTRADLHHLGATLAFIGRELHADHGARRRTISKGEESIAAPRVQLRRQFGN